ncbi:MAG: hypothetical protein F6K55_30990 [Moorea sp. SIO4A3]|nr:hypothetical protein [Moorena sp. SIO4A3]
MTVAAVWQVILGGGAEWLAETIVNFHLTPQSAKQAIESLTSGLLSKVKS